jgi:hypothetical protein
MNCTATENACRLGTDPNSNNLCNAVLQCARKNNCTGTACYCGTSLCIPPTGPCLKEIEAAAGTSDLLTIEALQNDQTMPLGKAYFDDTCRVQQCQSTCR